MELNNLIKTNIIKNITQMSMGSIQRLDEIHSSILRFKLKKVRSFILKNENCKIL